MGGGGLGLLFGASYRIVLCRDYQVHSSRLLLTVRMWWPIRGNMQFIGESMQRRRMRTFVARATCSPNGEIISRLANLI